MKTLIFILLLCPYALLGQSGRGRVEKKLKDGFGVVIEYGTPLMGYEYGPNDYSDTGKITAITEYKNYHIYGRRIQFFNYPYDTASVEYYKNDTLDGPLYYRFRNGKLRENDFFRKGKVVGREKYWIEDGTEVTTDLTYDSAKQRFYLGNKLCSGKKIVFDGNTWKGWVDVYFENGKVDSINSVGLAYWGKTGEVHRNYVNNTRKYIAYYKNGGINSINFSKIIKTRLDRFWQWKGKIYYRDNDSLSGDSKFIEFYNNSANTLKNESYYNNGLRIGTWKFYNDKGGRDSIQVYENDKLVKTIK